MFAIRGEHRDPEGPYRLIMTADYLHPDIAEPHSMRLKVAPGITRAFIHYSVPCDELRGKRGVLTIRVK